MKGKKMKTPQRIIKYTNTFNGRLKSLLKGAKASARNRGQEFSITYDDLLDLWNAQNGKCIYTGWTMTTTTHDLTLVSIERKDNAIGYTKENILLVCWCVNRARATMEKQDFLAMCKAITLQNSQE